MVALEIERGGTIRQVVRVVESNAHLREPLLVQAGIARAPAVGAEDVPVNDPVAANRVQHLADAPAIQALECAPRIGLVIIQRLEGVGHAGLARRNLERRPQVLPRRKEAAQVVFRLKFGAGHREGDGFDPRRLM